MESINKSFKKIKHGINKSNKSMKKMINENIKNLENVGKGISQDTIDFVNSIDEETLAKLSVMTAEEMLKFLPEDDQFLVDELLLLFNGDY